MTETSCRTLTFDTNLWELYPKSEGVYLKSISRLDEGVAVQIRLGSSLEDLSHFTYRINDQVPQRSDDGTVRIGFIEDGSPKRQETNTKVCAVSREGTRTRDYAININYYPEELYAASGQSAPGWVIVRNTDLVLSPTRPEDFLLMLPSGDEREFASENWGSQIHGITPDYERAAKLAVCIIQDLEGHRGIPSDHINGLSPFQQYEYARSGESGVACENIGPVFSLACNALDIPCRVLSMFRSHQERAPGEQGYELRLSEGHVTAEVFSKDLNQWVWIDPNFYILSAWLGTEGPLTMMELHLFVNNPNRVGHLNFKCYDAQRGRMTVEPFESCRMKQGLLNYFKQDQHFHFKIKEQM